MVSSFLPRSEGRRTKSINSFSCYPPFGRVQQSVVLQGRPDHIHRRAQPRQNNSTFFRPRLPKIYRCSPSFSWSVVVLKGPWPIHSATLPLDQRRRRGGPEGNMPTLRRRSVTVLRQRG